MESTKARTSITAAPNARRTFFASEMGESLKNFKVFCQKRFK
jgi:hypothetical protein